MSEIRFLTAEQAFPLVERGEAIPIDVRDARLFDNAHIAGAHAVPLAAIERGAGPPAGEQVLLLYCA